MASYTEEESYPGEHKQILINYREAMSKIEEALDLDEGDMDISDVVDLIKKFSPILRAWKQDPTKITTKKDLGGILKFYGYFPTIFSKN